MDEKRRRWDGGNIHWRADGKPLYVIEKKVGGKRWHISTRCHIESAAYDHLRRFLADPWAYAEEMDGGRAPVQGVVITDALIEEFGTWLTTRARPTTQKYSREMQSRLVDWMEDLRGRDLRTVRLQDFKAIIDGRAAGRQHRIIAIKALCGWLRTEKFLLNRQNDATLDLAVPQAVPEKRRRRKAVPAESVRAVLEHLAPGYRDCLLLLASTGWHVSELERFVREPGSELAPGRGEVLGVLQVLHKGRDTTRTPVTTQEALAAAKRLRERREIPRRLNEAIKAACRAAGVQVFTAGVMRHSVATWAVDAGTPIEQVSEFLNHKSKRTTATFYVDQAIPTATIRGPKLV